MPSAHSHHPDDAARAIEHLREIRVWKPRELGVAGLINDMRKQSQRTYRKLGDLIDLWRHVIPPRLADHTAITGYRGGVLQVTADSAGALFEIDRALREGLEDQLRRRFRGTLISIRLKQGLIEA